MQKLTRRQFIEKSTLLGAGIFFSHFSILDAENENQPVSFLSNPNLKTILPTWKGSPQNVEGRFMNHEFPSKRVKGAMRKWRRSENPQKQEKKNDTFRLPVEITDAFLHHTKDTVVWFGHASFFVRIKGINIVIDPVFDKIPIIKRQSKMPCKTEVFKNIDYILVSHAHYDHCDKSTIKELVKNNPKAQLLTGLKLDKLLQKWAPQHKVQGAGWYQQFQTNGEIKIVYLPARHRANRGLTDENKTLWGAFIIKSGDKTVYFGGDSGYGSHFKEAGQLYPNIDVAMIGIGAYSPRWFMHPHHQDPEQAAVAFNEMQAKLMIPMHYGTFEQTDEPRSEPPRLMQELIEAGKVKNKVVFPVLGEDVFF
jgi:L-ascorbate metabolism protein UlaG (beta-lactamase superfamily)